MLKIKKKLKFFFKLCQNIAMNGLSSGKISKMPKKNYFGRAVAFCVLGVHNRVFPVK